MLLSRSVRFLKTIISKFLSNFTLFFQFGTFFIIDTFEIYVFFFKPMQFLCNFSLPQKSLPDFSKILYHLLRYEFSKTFQMLRLLFNKKDIFLFLVTFVTFTGSLILTLCKSSVYKGKTNNPSMKKYNFRNSQISFLIHPHHHPRNLQIFLVTQFKVPPYQHKQFHNKILQTPLWLT